MLVMYSPGIGGDPDGAQKMAGGGDVAKGEQVFRW